jgi:hypothetical protein
MSTWNRCNRQHRRIVWRELHSVAVSVGVHCRFSPGSLRFAVGRERELRR